MVIMCLSLLCTSCISSFFDDDDDIEENTDYDSGYAGDSFDDVPSAYVLDVLTSPSSALPGKGNKTYPFRIRNAADLLCFVKMVNSGLLDMGTSDLNVVYVQLEHDIEIDSKYHWEPIGNSFNSDMCIGVFDGMGHSITGTLNCASPAVDGDDVYVGFFGVTRMAIKNLIMAADVDINFGFYDIEKGSSTRICIGSMAGWIFSTFSNIENCYFTGSINLGNNRIETGVLALGGLFGMCGVTKVIDCESDGKLNIGSPSAETMILGGISGWCLDVATSSTGHYERCVNATDILVEGVCCDRFYVGGIYGVSLDDINLGSRNDEVVSCENYGKINMAYSKTFFENELDIKQNVNVYGYVGGLVGYAHANDFSNNINHSDISLTNIESNTYVGGLCGCISEKMKSCQNEGLVVNDCKYNSMTGGCVAMTLSDVFECSNYKDVIGGNLTGGIVGYIANGAMHSCNNNGDVTGSGEIGGIAGRVISGASVYSCCINNGAVNGQYPYDNPYEYYIGASQQGVMPCDSDHSEWY